MSSAEQPKLANAPLVRVLAQLRWPRFAGFVLDDAANALGMRVAREFPLRSVQVESQITLGVDGIHHAPGGQLHRFSSLDEKWSATLGETFLSLETNAYETHEDFIARLTRVVASLSEVASIPVWDRLGYRYTNRLADDDDLNRLGEYLKPGVLGGHANEGESGELVHSITESLYSLASAKLLVRAALIPPRASVDPTIDPVEGRSFILDLDAFAEARTVFTVEGLEEQATALSAIATDHFFRSITPNFLERFK